MEGYSVTEAASILGVPTERVWELLARGVLAGAAEGETGMRVYLQPRPAPAPPAPESARSNGDPGQREPERELSPFRELLTEFRNLTERYGQALLALGEARGEVAALRSRVDLLEARMDLRLPMGGGMPAPTPWPASIPEPMVRPPAPEREVSRVEDGESAESLADEDRPSRRRRSARHATESFAEALARAEDPTRPELPGAADAAAALAALRAESSVDQPVADATLPRELPAAESMPTPDETVEGVVAAPAEAAEPEPEPEPEAESEPMVEIAAAEPEPEPMEVATTPPEPEPTDAATAEPEPQPQTASGPTAEAVAPEREPGPEPQPGTAAPQASPVEPQPETPPISFDPERYTVAIAEPDWWVEEEPASAATPAEDVAEQSALGVAEPPHGGDEDEPPSEEPLAANAPAEPEAPAGDALPADEAPAVEEPAGPADQAPGAVERPDDRQEETMLWFGSAPEASSAASGDGADEMEMAGGSTSRPSRADLPGSRELDEALAALDALAGRTPPAATTEPQTPPAAEPAPAPEPVSAPASEPQPEARPAWPMADRSVAHQSPRAPVIGPTSMGIDAQRLTSTPASRAYRRLRRIFPG
jgi:hypothetical protein